NIFDNEIENEVKQNNQNTYEPEQNQTYSAPNSGSFNAGQYYSNTNYNAQQQNQSVPHYSNNEPVYSPYSNRYNDQEYLNNQQNYSASYSGTTPEAPKKSKKGMKAFIIAIVAVVLCIAIITAVFPKISNGSKSETSGSTGDSTKIELNESPDASSKQSLTAQKIAEQSKKFNVGILLYGATQSFFSNTPSNSLAGEGSGIIMGEDSSHKYTYIVTCAHVISAVDKSGYSMSVQDYNGKKYDGKLVGYDAKTDVGVIKIAATGLTKAEFGDSSALKIGQTVYAIGNPGGTEFFGSFTNGMISSIDRPISSESGYEMKCIQHTTPINSGNSGGALMNEFGQVIGINSSKIVSTGYEGMAFSIPISEAKPIIDDIISHGYVTNRPKLGISYASASQYQQYEMIVKLKDLPSGSLVIASISDDSSLKKTDAQKGDLIIAVDGKKLDTPDVLLDKIENGKVGDKLELTLCRIAQDYSTKEIKVTATLIEDTGNSSADEEEQTTTQNPFEEFFGSDNPFGF
ncbi:MAG: serine protease, partial [Ruminococcus sp.]|nr:serine protease [Candidatus Copronaster equi]